jgi:hypothetical protein
MAQTLKLSGSQKEVLCRLAMGAVEKRGRWVAAESMVRKGLAQRLGTGRYQLNERGTALRDTFAAAALFRFPEEDSAEACNWSVLGIYMSDDAARVEANKYETHWGSRDHVVDVWVGSLQDAAAKLAETPVR